MELADYSVLKKVIFEDVYEPAEDTFILVDALEKNLSLIQQLKPAICLEIGSGSGVVISTLGKVLQNPYYLCTDINPIAASATQTTSKSNGLQVDIIITNLVDGLERLQNSVDLLIFNPPYAVTPSEEITIRTDMSPLHIRERIQTMAKLDGDIHSVGASNTFKATSGGFKGREVMDRLFPLVPKLLSKQGLFYLTCIQQNDIDEIALIMKSFSLDMTKVLCRKCGIEHLYVLRFSFQNNELDIETH